MRYAVPHGTMSVAVKGMQFDVEHGTIEAPDHFEADLRAAGCLPTKSGPIEINTGDADEILPNPLEPEPTLKRRGKYG